MKESGKNKMKIETYAEIHFTQEEVAELNEAKHVLQYYLNNIPEINEFLVGNTAFNFDTFHTNVDNVCKYIDIITEESKDD